MIIFDPSWNPAEDRQAVDRAFRIGQKKDVVVYRLIMASSVEEKMYEKQVRCNSSSALVTKPLNICCSSVHRFYAAQNYYLAQRENYPLVVRSIGSVSYISYLPFCLAFFTPMLSFSPQYIFVSCLQIPLLARFQSFCLILLYKVFKDGIRVVTESGSSSRYFSHHETKDLFTLGPAGECDRRGKIGWMPVIVSRGCKRQG